MLHVILRKKVLLLVVNLAFKTAFKGVLERGVAYVCMLKALSLIPNTVQFPHPFFSITRIGPGGL